MKTAIPILALLLASSALPLGGSADAPDEFTYDGVIQPSRLIHLGAASEGLVAEVLVDRGDVVQAGEVVARLDVAVDEANARLARARAESSAAREVVQARLSDVRRRLKYQESLLEDGFITPEEVTATRTELRIEELNLARAGEDTVINTLEHERARAVVDQGTLLSPIDGVVLERFVSPGEILSRAGQSEALTIAQLDPLYVELHLPVEMLESLSIGQGATVELDAPGSPRRAALVLVKDRLIDTASRTFRVRLELANPGYCLPAGLRCRVAFDE